MENFDGKPVENVAVLLAALAPGKPFAYRKLPLNGNADDPVVRACTALANQLLALDAAMAQLVDGDVRGNVVDLREAIAAAYVATQVRLASASKLVAAERDALTADERAFYLPAPTSEVLDQMRDTETRALFAAVTDEGERAAWWSQFAADQHGEVLAALCRSPLPSGISARAETVHRALAVHRSPATVAGFNRRSETIGWAVTLIGQVETILDQSSMQLGPQTAVQTSPDAPFRAFALH